MKITHPLFSLSAHGTLGNKLIFRRTPRGHAAYLHFKPQQPMSTAQQNHHTLWHLLADRWNYLTADDRDYWMPIAQHERMTTYNAYMQYNLERLNPAQPEGLIGWWPNLIPNGPVLHDLTSARNDGDLVNLDPTDAWALSLQRRGRVIEYDGTGHVDVPTPPSTTGHYTWAFWFKQNSYTGGSAIVDTGRLTRYSHAFFVVRRARHYLRNVQCGSPQMFLNDFTWHHYAGTWQGTNIQIYIDGVFRGLTPQALAPAAQVQMLFGARGVEDAFLAFHGQVDDLRFYNRELLWAQVGELAAR